MQVWTDLLLQGQFMKRLEIQALACARFARASLAPRGCAPASRYARCAQKDVLTGAVKAL